MNYVFPHRKIDDLSKILEELGITRMELSDLMCVNIRTVNRWVETPQEITGPATQALLAWKKLKKLGMSWRPDSVDIPEGLFDEVSTQIRVHRCKTVNINLLIGDEKKKNGPSLYWNVDIENCVATMGPARVTFYLINYELFCPISYIRLDGPPDLNRDKAILQDAYLSILLKLQELKTTTISEA